MKVFLAVGLSVVFCVAAHGRGDWQGMYGAGDPRLQVEEPSADMPLVLVQGGSGQSIRASGAGQSVEVGADYSFGSDITALFRPSRWRHPLRPGGVISWLNPGA